MERVFHCAALVSFDPQDTERLFLQNITGTANVVNAMLSTGVTKLCHVSSTATIGLRKDGVPSDESQEFARDRFTSPYGISKHEAELEVQRGIAEGLHAVMVNPCIVIGPGAHGRSSMTMIDRVRKGTRFFPPGSNAVVDARDVAEAMLRVMDHGVAGERHLVIGENLSYRELFTYIARTAGEQTPTRPLAPWMLELGWRVERVRSWLGGRPFITSYSARTAYRQRRYDGSKASALLGRPLRNAEAMVANVSRYLSEPSGGRAGW
jgi:nucleoside-diphosphate-sugar epimerase